MKTDTIPNLPAVAVISHIETLAKQYATDRGIVAYRVATLEDEVREVHRRKLPGIKAAVASAADSQAKLTAAIEAHPELFVQPRTMTLHGIKLGFQKGKGSTQWPEEAKLLAAIKKNFGPRALETLIETIEKPNKEAVCKLSMAELKKLGVVVTGTGDFVFVKASDSEVDKLVAKILKEGAIEEAAAA
jgi:hypothetical protein